MNVELSSRGEGKNSHVIVVNESAALGKQEDTPEDVNPRVSSSTVTQSQDVTSVTHAVRAFSPADLQAAHVVNAVRQNPHREKPVVSVAF